MDLPHLSGETKDSSELTCSQFSEDSSFRDWTGLLPDLLDLTVTKLFEFSDYLRFCGVCSQWRLIALTNANDGHKQRLDLLKASRNKLPMLMIKTEDNNYDWRVLYNISDGITYNLKLPLPCRNRFIGSSHGWLLSVEERDMVITLFNPLTNGFVSLPPFKDDVYENLHPKQKPDYFLVKGILTADPHSSPHDYTVAVIYGTLQNLAVYKSGDMHWKFIDLRPEEDHVFNDIVCYKTNIYGVTIDGKLVQVDTNSGSGKIILHESHRDPISYLADSEGELLYYLVESQGELLLVERFWLLEEEFLIPPKEPVDSDDEDKDDNKDDREIESDSDAGIRMEEFWRNYFSRPITFDFKIFKLVDEKECVELVQIESIGEQALFLGDNHGVSISTVEFPGILPDSIYFHNQYYTIVPPYQCFGPDEDSGFFSMRDKTCHSHHLLDICEWHIKPPIWFVPNLAIRPNNPSL